MLAALLGVAVGRVHAAQQGADRWPGTSVLAATARRWCTPIGRADRTGNFVAQEDLQPRAGQVDGNDLLALVDRSPRFALAPDWSPSDLIEVVNLRQATATACTLAPLRCLRRDAALAYRQMELAANEAGVHLRLHSGFRAFASQCRVVEEFAHQNRHGFCSASTVNAMPGHSQHQLGTAADILTADWTRAGRPFRPGFGCSDGGRWIAHNAWRFGFVLPYPLHPDHAQPGSDCLERPEAVARVDPRTGYSYEPWHVRYIGREHASAFREAWLRSGPGTPDEITLEQWLRAHHGVEDPVDPPVCDGCACEDCATFHPPDAATPGPCAAGPLTLGPDGRPLPPSRAPLLESVTASFRGWSVEIRARVHVPPQILTQPPMFAGSADGGYPVGASAARWSPGPSRQVRAYPALSGAWRLGIGLATTEAFPWRAALVRQGRDEGPNGINARIPSSVGEYDIRFVIEGVPPGTPLRAALLEGEQPRQARVVEGAPDPVH